MLRRLRLALALSALSLPFCLPPTPAKAAAAELAEVVLTDYVGNDNAKWVWPEFMSRIVLRRDGTAIYIGNPTYARLKGRFAGRISPQQFQRIAQLMPASLKLKPVYNGYGGARLARDEFRITRSDGSEQETAEYGANSGPRVLRQVRSIVDGLSWQVKWKSDASVDRHSAGLSGVRGNAVRWPAQGGRVTGVPTAGSLANAVVLLRNASGREIARGRTDRAGGFCILVKPGVYRASLIAPRSSRLRARSKREKVTVASHRFSDIDFDVVTSGA